MSDTEGMLKHFAFFEELSKMEEDNPAWRSVSAGVVTMRLVDRWIEDGPRAVRDGAWEVSSVREAIAQVAETTPVRRILVSIVDAMVGATTVDLHALCPRLMAYGQSLEYEAKWALAADIYGTIIAHAHPIEDADLAVAAHLQLAFCLRTLGNFDAAATTYSQAAQIAHTANDLIGVLRCRIGDAKIATARGNMPRAEAILEETIDRAATHGLDDVRSRALTDRAYIASLALQWDRTIRWSYEALELAKAQRDRDRILNNIAASFRHLGLPDSARDAYLVLATTADEQYMRWMAELNLMELAAADGHELQFDKYRRDLDAADLNPQLRITYLIHVGRAYQALDQSETGIPYLERAVEMASSYGLNQLLFDAESALADGKKRKARDEATKSAPFVTSEVRAVADAVHGMRTAAGIA